MKTTIIATLLMATTILSYGQNELPKAFADLLEKAGLTFTFPEKFTETPVIKNSVLNYDYAIKYTDPYNTYELRFLVVPSDANSPEDKEWFSRNFASNLSTIFTTPFIMIDNFRIGDGDLTNPADFITSYEHRQGQFGDGYTFKTEFAQQYTQGMIVAMHKKGLGAAYVFLLGTKASVFDYDSKAYYTLTFKK